MMDLFDRLRRARIVQVLAFYLGASWVILQVVDVLQEALSLPEWVAPVAVILLMIGLVIIAATAMIQSEPSPVAAGDSSAGSASVAPGDTEVSDLDPVSSPVERLFTWKRSIAGGVAAFVALFVVAGIAVNLGTGGGVGPTEVAADEAGAGVAVLPFSVNGPDMDVWSEGMVDLLADNLDGTGGLRAIDPRTVMSRWRDRVPNGASPDLGEMLDIAEETGARYAVVGSAVSLAGSVRMTTDVYDVLSGEPLGSGAVEGASADVMDMVDRLSVETAGAVLPAASAGQLTLRFSTSNITRSPVALRAYLEGEALYRQADFAGASDAFRRAVAQDSAFALANLRLSRSIGWLRNIGDPEAQDALERALAFTDRLPPREAELLAVEELLEMQDFGAIAAATSAARSYPDDAEAWELLGEAYSHQGSEARISLEEALDPFDRAIAIDPTFSPIYFHPMEMASALGDSERAFDYLEAMQEHSFDEGRAGRYDIFLNMQFGDSEVRDATMERVRDEVPDREMVTGWVYGFRRTAGSAEPDLRMAREMRSRGMAVPAVQLEQSAYLSTGRVDEAFESTFSPAFGDNTRSSSIMLLQWSAWGGPDDDPRVRALIADDECDGQVGCFAKAVLAADLKDWDRHEALVARYEAMVAEQITSTDTLDAEQRDQRLFFLNQERLWPDAARAYGAWRRGQVSTTPSAFERARPLQPFANWAFNMRSHALRYWVAETLLAEGQAEQAARHYESLWGSPVGGWYTIRLVGLGDAMQAMGRAEEARSHYEEFLEAWAAAPADHPLMQRARAGLARLD